MANSKWCEWKEEQKWKKKQFLNLLGNPPEVTDKPTKKILNSQLNFKLGHFAEEELDAVLKKKKIKSRKAATIDKISPEVWKAQKFDDIILWLCNTVYKQNIINKRLHLPLPQEKQLLRTIGVKFLLQ